MSDLESGIVKFFDAEKGFGFIASDLGGDIFFHKSALRRGTSLHKGARVRFEMSADRIGRPRAEAVEVVAAAPPQHVPVRG